jgi:drug/metabolite transporter (DMT)-like permease
MSGALLAIVALFGWGIADFFVQKAARKAGVATTLFAGGVFGVVVLAPFVFRDIGAVLAQPKILLLLSAFSGVGVVTALFSLEAYRKGKLAVIEPIMGLELPVTILLAVFFWSERLTFRELLPMGVVFMGLLMTVTRNRPFAHLEKKTIEKGALLGLAAAIGLGTTNFLTGVASQVTSPLLAIWFGRAIFTLGFGAYLLAKGRMKASFRAMREHAGLVFGLSTLYLIAFMSYATATTLISISVATTISESYIVLAALLGVFVNKEKLARHQAIGAAIAVAGVLTLAYISSTL